MKVNNTTQVNETLSWTWTEPVPVYTRITLCSVLLVWSLLGNVLVIAVVYCLQNLRTNMNYMIVNMAVSDLLVPLVAMPMLISMSATNFKWVVEGPLGEALCKLVPFFSDISPVVSSISLVIIAFQRFMAVVYPRRGQISSRKTRWFAISFPWIVAMALYSPYLYIYRLTNAFGYTRCIAFWSLVGDHEDATAYPAIFYSMLLGVGFAVPLIVIITLYIMIIYKLRRSLDNVRGMMEEEMIRTRQKKNRRIFSMLITIVVLFTICWCPYTVLNVIDNAPNSPLWSLDIDIFSILHFAFWYMWYFLAAINPCIYFVFLKDFRQGLKSLCCRKTTSASKPIFRRPRTPGGDRNQDPTCTPLHMFKEL